MENFRQNKIEIDYTAKNYLCTDEIKNLEKLVNKLNSIFKKDNQNFADLCICIYNIKKIFDKYYSAWVYDKNKNMLNFDSIMDGFGIDKTQSSRILTCCKKFVYFNSSDEVAGGIIDIYIPFSKSKLFELIPVPDEQLEKDIRNKVLRADMSVKSIRDYVNNYKAMEKANQRLKDGEEISPREDKPAEINEEEIPMAFDPKNYYEFNYFETKTKSQLLNIVWDLQKECQKLRKELKK